VEEAAFLRVVEEVVAQAPQVAEEVAIPLL
jgi:hypothetical protein